MIRLEKLSLSVLSAMFAASTIGAQTVQIGAALDPGEETALVMSPASGDALVTLDTGSGALTLTGAFADLTSNATVAHIHGPAARGQTANPVVTLTVTGDTGGFLSGNATLSAQQMADLLAGLYYVNLHSENHGPGEIRGQLDLTPTVDCPAASASDPVLADAGGSTFLGPNIDDALEPFGATLDCSGAGSPGVYAIQIRQNKLGAPASTGLGDLWIGGPKLVSFVGTHNQDVAVAGPVTLPNDAALAGLSYGLQGFCGGRLSNARLETIGLP